jgi:integrase
MIQPWWRTSHGAWYATLGGRQHLLAKAPSKGDRGGRQRAQDALVALLGAQQLGDRPTVLAVLEAFLGYVQANRAPETYRWYRGFLADFAGALDVATVDALKPHHVTCWADSHATWASGGSRRAGITAVKRCFAWAVAEGLIPTSPLAHVRRPPVARRETLISDDDHRRMLGASSKPFRLVLITLRHLGCRPIDVRTVTAADVQLDLGAWVFPVSHPANKTGAKTGRPRVVYLTPCITTLTRILLAAHTDGPLYRTHLGRPWTTEAICERFVRLRKKLGLAAGTTAYAYRHTYATEGLVRGVGTATMAELLGHGNVAMIEQHYGHLARKTAHLRDAAVKASGLGAKKAPGEPGA